VNRRIRSSDEPTTTRRANIRADRVASVHSTNVDRSLEDDDEAQLTTDDEAQPTTEDEA
jgi:hypothetical protein